jgi:phosphoserine phosphatase RsbU/P
MNRIKFLAAASAVLIISVIIIGLLYRDTHPLGGILTDIDAADVRNKSLLIFNDLGINPDRFTSEIKLRANSRLIRQTQSEFGLSQANELMRSGIPGYYWDANWKLGSAVTFNGEEEPVIHALTESPVRLKFDSRGNLLEFRREINDTIVTAKLNKEEAELLAANFIHSYARVSVLETDTLQRKTLDTLQTLSFLIGSSGRVEFKSEKKTEQENRTDYEFFYSGKDEILNNDIRLTVKVAGDLITGYTTEYVIAEGTYSAEYFRMYEAITVILFYAVIFILLGIVGFRRVRAFEIGFRTAVIMGITTSLFFAVELYLIMEAGSGWEVFIPLILGPLLYGGGVMLIWAVSETISREVWNEKMISLDLLTKGYLLHSKVGTAFLTGIAGGIFFAAAFLVLLFFAGSLIPIWFSPGENTFFSQFNSPSPALTLLTHFVYTSIFVTTIFFLFITSGLRKRVNTVWLIIITSVLWGLVNAKDISPLYASVAIEVVIGFLLVWLFYRFDLLTVLTGIIVYYLVLSGTSLFYQQDATFLYSGYFIASVLILLAGLSIVTLYTRDNIKDYQNITPVFVKNITERQRMQRELEIARDVQMSFLPGKNPDFKGLDIAGRCYPANEVGGDYYDFIEISEDKSGIIVGDVSGKGTQAAFYMTLTKGFLKAVSKVSDSPSEVLSQMNELFYQNVERGTFISMIYGIFDIENRKIRLARAGHNPVIVKRSSVGEVGKLNPRGLAIGLEKGIIFRRTISEVELPVSSGEVYLFYTDGFTEAMDRNKSEYGEERLTRYLEANSHLNALEILDGIYTEVKQFMGRAYQHDDMTMVVVKVK